MERWVSVLGGSSLASSALYVSAMLRALSVDPTGPSGWLIDVVPPLVMVPFVLTAVYFWVRVQAGRWMLERGQVDEALAYASARVSYSFWKRGARESMNNRVVAARAALASGKPVEARLMLWRAEREDETTTEWLELVRWRAEVLLRERRWEEVVALPASASAKARREDPLERGSLHACVAEALVEMGDLEGAKAQLDEAEWRGQSARLAWSQAQWYVAKGFAPERALEALELEREILREQIPGRDAEVAWVLARMSELAGDAGGAEEFEEDAKQRLDGADERAARVVRASAESDEEE